MGVQVVDFGSHDYVAEDGEYLVCIEYPLFFLKAIDVVELLDFLVHHLGASEDGFHFADWRFGYLQLVENHLALVVRLLSNYVVVRFKLFHAFLCRLQVALYSGLVKAEFLFDIEG